MPLSSVRSQVAQEDRGQAGQVPGLPPAEMGHAGSSAEKRCPKCGIMKLKTDFTLDNRRKSKLKPWCRECCRNVAIAHRTATNPKYKPQPPMGGEPGVTKGCRKCGKIKPLSEFGPDKRLKSGRFSWCRKCASEDQHARGIRDFRKRREESIAKRKAEVEGSIKTCSRCHEDKPVSDFGFNDHSRDGRSPVCRRCDSARASLWGKLNPEKEKARRARRDPEKVKARTRRWIQEHLAAYRQKCKERQRKYYADRPWAGAVKNARRRALKQHNSVVDTRAIAEFTRSVYTAKKIICYWCRVPVPTGKRTIDHIIPLSKGGPHVEWNLCCSCGSCNSKKWAKDPADFSGQGELLLLPVEGSL
jgi:5-methylcytosine-specific restriction endonuclease McrA